MALMFTMTLSQINDSDKSRYCDHLHSSPRTGELLNLRSPIDILTIGNPSSGQLGGNARSSRQNTNNIYKPGCQDLVMDSHKYQHIPPHADQRQPDNVFGKNRK